MNNEDFVRLQSGTTEVAIAPHRGAIVTSFRVDNRELLYLDEGTFNDPSKNVRGGIPVLFPSPGKLDHDRWQFGNHQGELKQHGFARNRAWEVVARSASSVSLSLDADAATLGTYPWRFAAQLTYTLRPQALRIEFQIRQTSNSPMPFAYGLHPYFNVSDKAHARIPTGATRAFDNVTKQLVDFNGFDFTHDEVDMHLIDHGSTRASLELDDQSRIAIETSGEFIRWVIWTVRGKDYICLEPWTAPGNALNTREGLLLLQPNETRTLSTTIAFER